MNCIDRLYYGKLLAKFLAFVRRGTRSESSCNLGYVTFIV